MAARPEPHKATTGRTERDLLHRGMRKSHDKKPFWRRMCVESRLEWVEERVGGGETESGSVNNSFGNSGCEGEEVSGGECGLKKAVLSLFLDHDQTLVGKPSCRVG